METGYCSEDMKEKLLCLFCRGCVEGRDHIFFRCGFSYRIWREILKQFGKRWWNGEVLSLEAVVYHIWKHGNDVRHGNALKSEEQILKIIINWEIRTLIMGIGKFKRSEINKELCRRWGLHDKILCEWNYSVLNRALWFLVLLSAKFRKVVGTVGCVAVLAAKSGLHWIISSCFVLKEILKRLLCFLKTTMIVRRDIRIGYIWYFFLFQF